MKSKISSQFVSFCVIAWLLIFSCTKNKIGDGNERFYIEKVVNLDNSLDYTYYQYDDKWRISTITDKNTIRTFKYFADKDDLDDVDSISETAYSIYNSTLSRAMYYLNSNKLAVNAIVGDVGNNGSVSSIKKTHYYEYDSEGYMLNDSTPGAVKKCIIVDGNIKSENLYYDFNTIFGRREYTDRDDLTENIFPWLGKKSIKIRTEYLNSSMASGNGDGYSHEYIYNSYGLVEKRIDTPVGYGNYGGGSQYQYYYKVRSK